MIANPNDPVEKRVGERYSIGIKYKSPDLEAGETILSSTATVSPSGLTLDGAVSIDGDTVKQMIKEGASGVKYAVTFTVNTSAGHIYLDDVLVKVT